MKKIILNIILLFWFPAFSQTQKMILADSNLRNRLVTKIEKTLEVSNQNAVNIYSIVSYYHRKEFEILRDTTLRAKVKAEQLRILLLHKQNRLNSILTNEQVDKLKILMRDDKLSIKSDSVKINITTLLIDEGIPRVQAEKVGEMYKLYSVDLSKIYRNQTMDVIAKREKSHLLMNEFDQKLKAFLSPEQFKIIKHQN